jgi:hypothetical protein
MVIDDYNKRLTIQQIISVVSNNKLLQYYFDLLKLINHKVLLIEIKFAILNPYARPL